MVLSRVLAFVCLLLPVYAATATDADLLNCDESRNDDTKICTRPIDNVVPVTPGVHYTAKIRCYDCPYTEWQGGAKDQERIPVSGDVDLLFNIALSSDNRSIYLNNEPFFPHLQTIPTPPQIWTPRVRPGFSYRNLSSALACPKPLCRTKDSQWMHERGCTEWCYELRLDEITIDYLYTTRDTEYAAEDSKVDAQYWEFTFDPIGSSAGYLNDPKWGFDNPSQQMLKVVLEGTESGKQKFKDEKNMQAGSSLFGPFGEDEKLYDYVIREVSLVDRDFKFPARTRLTFWGRISRFFGNDVWEEEARRLVYITDEWGQYGKEGTLRNMFGNLIHWYLWPLIWLIVFSVIGGLTVLYGTYRLFYWMQAQRELMKWNGIDNVWDNLRREREEEENRLLDGSYRDEPEQGESSRPSPYTDDVDTMKPLPAKPLPDKPLPEVPLIDA